MGPIAPVAERGVDVIVSDHHELAGAAAAGGISVRASASAWSAAGSEGLPLRMRICAGRGWRINWLGRLARKICNAERVSETYRNLLLEFSALVGLGTIADVVPLVGENRILVKYGLAQLARTQFEGLQALIHAAGYGEGEKKLDCMAVGFALAPRLNAAGRMGHAREAVELLTTATGARAVEIAAYLEAKNRDRQNTEKKMVEIAKGQVIGANTEEPLALPDVIVVAHESRSMRGWWGLWRRGWWTHHR